MSATVSRVEISRFGALAETWWDPSGPMRALHAMNPTRVGWIAERIQRRFGPAPVPLLDVGCGAGIAAEALARRGFAVTGLDASAELIAAAEAHAEAQGVSVTYRQGAPEDLLAEGARFSVVVALEVIEHVPEPEVFLKTLANLVMPGGLVFLSTLNRTFRSFLAAKVGAEYVLRWLPIGTHEWRRFLTPQELGALLTKAGLRLADITGLRPSLRTPTWQTTRDLSINYLVCAEA